MPSYLDWLDEYLLSDIHKWVRILYHKENLKEHKEKYDLVLFHISRLRDEDSYNFYHSPKGKHYRICYTLRNIIIKSDEEANKRYYRIEGYNENIKEQPFITRGIYGMDALFDPQYFTMYVSLLSSLFIGWKYENEKKKVTDAPIKNVFVDYANHNIKFDLDLNEIDQFKDLMNANCKLKKYKTKLLTRIKNLKKNMYH